VPLLGSFKTRPRAAYAALAVAWLAGAGCANDFPPYSKLDRLRILAIASDPATPSPGEQATLSALTFAPLGESTSYHWTWCPAQARADQAYRCPVDQTAAAQAFGAALDASTNGVLPSLDLGTASTALFTNPFSLAGLSTLCAVGVNSSVYSQGFDCEGGFPVSILLDVTVSSGTLRAGYVLRLPASATPEINQNPYPTGIELAGQSLLDPPTTIALSPGQTVDLHIDLPTGVAETRSIPPSEGGSGQRLERLTASWFSDSGKIDADRTSFIDGEATLDQMAQNRWTAPALDQWPADGQVELAVVLRDDRGGEGWMVRRVLLVQGP
jgi:hypothetical protein